MENGAAPYSHYLLKGKTDKAGIVQDGWPSSSPDLNPIEIIWDYMKDSISLISKLYLLKNEKLYPKGKSMG